MTAQLNMSSSFWSHELSFEDHSLQPISLRHRTGICWFLRAIRPYKCHWNHALIFHLFLSLLLITPRLHDSSLFKDISMKTESYINRTEPSCNDPSLNLFPLIHFHGISLKPMHLFQPNFSIHELPLNRTASPSSLWALPCTCTVWFAEQSQLTTSWWPFDSWDGRTQQFAFSAFFFFFFKSTLILHIFWEQIDAVHVTMWGHNPHSKCIFQCFSNQISSVLDWFTCINEINQKHRIWALYQLCS